jgi:hypothetical protein
LTRFALPGSRFLAALGMTKRVCWREVHRSFGAKTAPQDDKAKTAPQDDKNRANSNRSRINFGTDARVRPYGRSAAIV